MAMRALNLSIQRPPTALLFGIPHLEFDDLLNQVHVWAVDLGQWNLHCREALQVLPESERKKAEHLHFEIHQTRYIKCHYLLRVLLGMYLGVDFYDQEFHISEHGKPSIKNPEGGKSLYFNLSNSENAFVCVFTQEGDVGVDVEKIHDMNDIDGIVERFFSPDEHKIFRSLPGQNRKQSFFKYWARKEALLKGIGVGLSYPMNKVDVTTGDENSSQLVTKLEGSGIADQWTLLDMNIFTGFTSALALKGAHPDCTKQVRCFNLTDQIITPINHLAESCGELTPVPELRD